ncbi:MAG: EutN/CcmL family microcompartment protein [Planctomycetota bacterium]
MLLALVKGHATSTVKDPTLEGKKLLVCVELDPAGKTVGDPLLVVDKFGAGAGQIVMLSSDGLGARDLIGDNKTPVRWFTLGVIETRHAPGSLVNA